MTTYVLYMLFKRKISDVTTWALVERYDINNIFSAVVNCDCYLEGSVLVLSFSLIRIFCDSSLFI